MSRNWAPSGGSRVKYAFANVAASSTDSALVAAVANRKIRVISIAFVCGATATTLTLNTKPSGAGSAISPAFQNAAHGGAVLGFNEGGWCETNVGEGLAATTGTGSTTGILLSYIEWGKP